MQTLMDQKTEQFRSMRQATISLAFEHIRSQLAKIYDTCIVINEDETCGAGYASGIGTLAGLYYGMLSDFSVATKACQELQEAGIPISEVCKNYIGSSGDRPHVPGTLL
jgi:hypothetical protein